MPQYPLKTLSINAEAYLAKHLCKHGLYTTGTLDLRDAYDKDIYRQLSTLFPQDTFLHYEPLPESKVEVWYIHEWKQNYAFIQAKKAQEGEQRRLRLIESEIIVAIAKQINLPMDDKTKQTMAEGFYKSKDMPTMQPIFQQFGINIQEIVKEIEERNKPE